MSFITLVAYDYRFVPEAVASYYDIADEIILGLDRDRISWSGKPFQVDLDWLKAALAPIDTQGKLRWVEGDFHSAASPMACDTEERMYLAGVCKDGHWIVQIDADERLANPQEFAAWLQQADPDSAVYASWLQVYKAFEHDVLVVDDDWQLTQVASRARRGYVTARISDQRKTLISPLRLLHFAWGREEAELAQKLRSWSHAHDFDLEAALARWRAVGLDNWAAARDLHPIYGPQWPRLRKLPLDPAALKQAALEQPQPKRLPNRLDGWLRKIRRRVDAWLGRG